MIERLESIATAALAWLIAVSAVAGGVGLLGGGLAFPLEWLASTPFGSYALPGAILAFAVGGSALLAAVLLVRRHPLAQPVGTAAGLVQVGWIVGEVVLVGTHGDVMLWLQIAYVAAGAALAATAAHLWLRTRPPRSA